ncbi:glucokinase [Thermodesulfobacterium hydrogeniphilum]|uniref:glucokinase n=1 Tax=Thermodesulfobacterium hydrogeniphilum TaxID=161156 RepID=UPI00056F41CC|nr:ROK family protein [Thermodesulfobacterium hydrogeniphilum]
MILIADIGGTNSRFGLLKNRRICSLKIYKSKNFKSFYQVLRQYLSDLKIETKPVTAFFAVAGPVFKNIAYLTNLNWKISVPYLKRSFGFKKIILVNDLYSLSASSLLLKRQYILNLKKGKVKQSVPKAFIAPGTGLGEAILVKKDPLIILPTEGGHIFFSPLNDEEFGYLNFLKEKEEELSWEKALSGKALSYWYEYFYKEILKPEEITEFAKKGDKKALKVIQKFLELLGRKSSQLALYSLPQGGIYLAGGVIHALKIFLEKKEFKEKFLKGYFENKKMQKVLEEFSINIITHPNPCLLGALAILRNQI